jgi:hypothetical protein
MRVKTSMPAPRRSTADFATPAGNQCNLTCQHICINHFFFLRPENAILKASFLFQERFALSSGSWGGTSKQGYTGEQA